MSSLFTKAAQHITAQCQFRLDALSRSAPCIDRMERLIDKLSRQGIDAKGAINVKTGNPELVIHGDETTLRNAIEDTGHIVGRSGVPDTWIIAPPRETREYAISFIAWINRSPAN
jgi:hypothetical protein